MKTRDERDAAPGWAVLCINSGTPDQYWETLRAEDANGATDLESREDAAIDTWKRYDAEHGYAPTDEQRVQQEQRALAVWNGTPGPHSRAQRA